MKSWELKGQPLRVTNILFLLILSSLNQTGRKGTLPEALDC